MKNKKIIGVMILIMVIIDIGGYKIYANKQAEQGRIALYTKIRTNQINEIDLKYIEINKLVSQELTSDYKGLRKQIENNKLSTKELNKIEENLGKTVYNIDKELKIKVKNRKISFIKKVNKLQTKTKDEKSKQNSIKTVLIKKIETKKDIDKNIFNLVKEYQETVKQNEKIKALKEQIDKRIVKYQIKKQINNDYQSTKQSKHDEKKNNYLAANSRPAWLNQGGDCINCKNVDVKEE